MKLLVLYFVVLSLSISSARIVNLADDAEIIPDQYIVKLKPNVVAQSFIENQILTRANGQSSPLESNVNRVYQKVFNGFSVKLDANELRLLDSKQEIDIISPNQIYRAVNVRTQTDAVWGLSRMSHKHRLPPTGPYNYSYHESAGEESTVYIVDTGIFTEHSDFEGRAVQGVSFVENEDVTDLNGHGTHCAGTVGGKTYGVAKKVKLVAVKVLNARGSGSSENVISGIEWVAKNAGKKSVMSMSLGASFDTLTNDAVNSAVSKGITVVVAAGNSGANACSFSPASARQAITVGASALNDSLTSFSNNGRCIDIIAPGHQITSTWIGSNTATRTASGTSMAAPHVAGLAAYLLTRHGLTEPRDVWERINDFSHKNSVKNLPLLSFTPNKLCRNDV